MPDENGNALPGEKGHWRFKKDSAALKEKHGTTGMKDIEKPKVEEKVEEKPKDPQVEKDVEKAKKTNKAYTEKEAKALNRQQQLQLLKDRIVTDFPSKAKEAELVKLILSSNPK